MITSSHNPKLQLIRALLGRPKERHAAGAFVTEGVRLVEEAFIARWPFRFVLYSSELNNRGQELVGKLKVEGVDVEEVARHLLQSISETEASQGILAVLELTHNPYPLSPTFILIPDQIRDPGNLGTLLRTADAAGVQAALIPPETTDPFAPKVVRAGIGAHFKLPIHSLSWDEIQRISESAKLKVFLAEMDGRSCWETDFSQPLALIVGGEAEGASEQARRLADVCVKIPMPGETES
jgi:TrmH family RNA methyltransferase